MAFVNPWRGRILAVWNLPPAPERLIELCQRYAFDGVEIKVSDGDSPWRESRHVTRGYVDHLKAAGLRVLGWSYNYCDGAVNAGDRGNGVPEREARVALERIQTLGLEGWTADLEIECEGFPENVAKLLDTVSAGTSVPIAAHVWAYLVGHGGYPAREIVERVMVVRPMIYRPVWAARMAWTEWAAYGILPDRFCPIWGITEATAADLAADRAFAIEQGVVGEAFWELSALPLPPDLAQAVLARHAAEVPAQEPVPQGAALDDLDALWAISQRFLARYDALGTRTGHALQAIIDSVKFHPAA